MITTKLIIQAMTLLSATRKLFWSEADFQFSLVLALHNVIPPNAKIYLERPIAEILSAQQESAKTKNRKKFYVDIWIQIDDTVYPIELKYGTKEQEMADWDGKTIKTVNQAAYDITRFGYLFDIYRIEQIKKHLLGSENMKFGRGFAILLTNDANYYAHPTKNIANTRDVHFRLHQGNTIKRVEWNNKNVTDHWTKNKYPYNIEFNLPSNFNLDWEVYLQDETQGTDIRYLINTIEP